MATSFKKTFQVVVTFTRDDGGNITETDINSVKMRKSIKKEIEEIARRGVGVYNAQPGTVTES